MTGDPTRLSVVPDEPEDPLFALAQSFAARAEVARSDDLQRVSEALLAGRGRARKKAGRLQFVQIFAAAAVVSLAVAIPLWRMGVRGPKTEVPVGTARNDATLDAGSRSPIVVLQPVAPPVAPTRVALRRHQMTVEPGSDWAIETPRGDQAEAFVVRTGTVLFDVKPLARGERFFVKAASIQVEVLGTVFSVTNAQNRARVRVYEGRVTIRRPGGTTITVQAPGEFDSGSAAGDKPSPEAPSGAPPAQQEDREARTESWPLEQWGLAAAAERASSPPENPQGSDAIAQGQGDHAQAPSNTHVPSHEAEPAEAPHDSEEEGTETPRPVRPGGLELDDARSMIASGRYREVLDAIRQGHNVGHTAGEWALVEGDAYSVQQDHEQAARAYERATRSSNASRAAVAGHLAAIEYEQLRRPADAIRVLEATRAYSGNSPVGQSAASLRARLLFSTGRKEEAREAAHAYLMLWPHGRFSAEMTRIESSP